MTNSECRVEAETFLYAMSSTLLLAADAVWPHLEPGVLTAEETEELHEMCDSVQLIGVRVMELGQDLRNRA